MGWHVGRMRSFRFGTNLRSVDDVTGFARWAEGAGFDSVLLPDHLGGPGPFTTLAAVAAVTERVRVGTYVLNVPFWNTALLAREIATLDSISGGRVELGLGAGHMKHEFELAGLPWESFDERCARVEHAVAELQRLLPEVAPEARGFRKGFPPLMIGAASDRLLRLAAVKADIVAHTGIRQVAGQPPGTFRLLSAAEVDERVAFAAEAAGARADSQELGILMQHVEITDDRDDALQRLAKTYGEPDIVPILLDTPVIAVGTIDEVADQLRRQRERFGFSYVVTHQASAEALAQVMPQLR